MHGEALFGQIMVTLIEHVARLGDSYTLYVARLSGLPGFSSTFMNISSLQQQCTSAGTSHDNGPPSVQVAQDVNFHTVVTP
jgi:hypothetical protein